MSTNYDIRLVGCMEKISPAWQPPRNTKDSSSLHLSGWHGQTASFQIAWRAQSESLNDVAQLHVHIECNAHIRLYRVGLVPCAVPKYPYAHPEGYICEIPTLLPDILFPLTDEEENYAGSYERNKYKHKYTVKATHTGWHAIWCDVQLPCPHVKVSVSDTNNKQLFSHTVDILNVPSSLPAPDFIFTQWFHADTLAAYHRCDMWSPLHWRSISSGMRSAAHMGVTSLLTPLWTPPIDTAPGVYRPLTQLLEIKRDKAGKYYFDTSKLDLWLKLLLDSGIKYVEVPHLFTQWGAKHAAHICVTDLDSPDVIVQEFGWDTDACDPEYKNFLQILIPFIKNYFAQKVGLDHVLFHISDEPDVYSAADYHKAVAIALPLLKECTVIDAVSDSFYQKTGQIPVVATDAVQKFRAQGIEPKWVYHCCAQYNDVSNRFIAQEPVRTRAIGWQIYKNHAHGLLHWGFNFYSSALSQHSINPYIDTTGGGAFPSGDSFIVYPDVNGETLESLRHRYIKQGIDDLAVAQYAQTLLEQHQLIKIIDPTGKLDYSDGWCSGEEWQMRRYYLDRECRNVLRSRNTSHKSAGHE